MKTFAIAVLLTSLVGIVSGQIQTGKLTPSDSWSDDEYGNSMASTAHWLMVGKRRDSEIASGSGAVYAYARAGDSWVEAQKLKASDAQAGDFFGWQVAIDGGVCVIGAHTEDPLGIHAAGSCYIFELIGGVWTETAKIWASDAINDATFGYAVAISGDCLLIGARQDGGAGYRAGAAYVFERVGPTWTQTAKLAASDPNQFDFFGASVALTDDFALIGSSSDGPGGAQDQGAAYVFERIGSSWTQVAKLVSSDGVAQDFFSSSVAIDQAFAIVTALGHDHGVTSSGAIYVFERQGSLWVQTQELRAHDPMSSHRLGAQASMNGDFYIAGATGDGPAIGLSRGAAYLFAGTPSGWIEIGKAVSNDAANYDLLASSVALSNDSAFAGAIFDDDACPTDPGCNSGAAYVFKIAPDARQYGHCANNAPCGNTDNHGGCANSTGAGATLAAGGSSSIALDELQLEVRHLQPAKSAIVFMGAGQGQYVLGDGLRVVAPVGSGFYRFPLEVSDGDGAFIKSGLIAHSQNFPPTGQFTPGSTWNFQCWYRDPAGPCGQGTNLTNGVAVTFRP